LSARKQQREECDDTVIASRLKQAAQTTRPLRVAFQSNATNRRDARAVEAVLDSVVAWHWAVARFEFRGCKAQARNRENGRPGPDRPQTKKGCFPARFAAIGPDRPEYPGAANLPVFLNL
jgi:hypothetical protein